MAVLAAAALLDELMGRNRNIAPHEKGKELNWEDAEYCKFFMVKFCPHDLFVNTKADLGSCIKVHDEEARKLFEESKPLRKVQYQEEFIRFCNSMLNDVERKIVKGKQRLALSGKGVAPAATTSEEGSTTPGGTVIPATTTAVPHRNQEQIDLLTERINGLVEEAEQAGNQGNVEQAQGLMKLCDQLKDERDQLQRPPHQGYPGQHWPTNTAELAAAQEKQMEVCEVCGAFLIVGDAQQRIEDHLTGKQHMGYARLKAAIDEIAVIVEEVRDKDARHRMGLGGGRGYGGGRDRHRGRDSGRGLDRERSRSPQRDRKDRDSAKERRSGGGGDRDRKDRDKDRDRDRDSSKRDKKDGDKDRDKDRDRKHRSDRDSGRDGRSSSGRHSSHRLDSTKFTSQPEETMDTDN